MLSMQDYKNKVDEAVRFLAAKIKRVPAVVIILGTGLGDLVDGVEADCTLPYEEIPHFPQATVTSHQGNLIFGRLSGRDVAVLQGRFHFYEGYSTRELTFPLRTLAVLGARTLLLTNAAGGLAPHFAPGTIMIMRDHINLIGENPLRGENIDSWGPRFPDLSAPYDHELIGLALQCAQKLGMSQVTTGVYVAVPGPSLETPAETRFLRNVGADAVGMSSVPEVIVARHAGMRVLALSAIANVNNPDDFSPILLDDVIRTVEKMGPELKKLITAILETL